MSLCHVACVDGFSAPIGCPRTHTWRHLGRLQVILAASRRTLRVGHCLYECRQAFLQRWYSCYTPLIYHPSALRLCAQQGRRCQPAAPQRPQSSPGGRSCCMWSVAEANPPSRSSPTADRADQPDRGPPPRLSKQGVHEVMIRVRPCVASRLERWKVVSRRSGAPCSCAGARPEMLSRPFSSEAAVRC